MNPNIGKWVTASITKHFIDVVKTTNKFEIIPEGMSVANKESNYCELRITGPIFTELSKNFYKIEVFVNVLINTVIDNDNIYTKEDNCRKILPAFDRCISVYKYGDGGNLDDNTFIDYLNRDDPVEVLQFGQIDPTIRVMQTTIDSKYCMHYSAN